MKLLRFVIILFCKFQCQGVSIPVKYMGCMMQEGVDEHNPHLANRRGSFISKAKIKEAVSINNCVYECFSRRFKMAAMQGGNRCYCGTHTRRLIVLKDEFCYERCAGNCRQRCGGLVTLSVYKTGYQREPHLTFPHWWLTDAHIGCFPWRLLPHVCTSQKRKPTLRSPRMTPKMCVMYCYSGPTSKRYPVAVLEAIDVCCCGASRDSAHHVPGRVPNERCSTPCIAAKQYGHYDKSQCVGMVRNHEGQMERVFTSFDVWSIRDRGLPHEPLSTFQPERSGWVAPVFPTRDQLELKDGIIQFKLDSRQDNMTNRRKRSTRHFGTKSTKRALRKNRNVNKDPNRNRTRVRGSRDRVKTWKKDVNHFKRNMGNGKDGYVSKTLKNGWKKDVTKNFRKRKRKFEKVRLYKIAKRQIVGNFRGFMNKQNLGDLVEYGGKRILPDNAEQHLSGDLALYGNGQAIGDQEEYAHRHVFGHAKHDENRSVSGNFKDLKIIQMLRDFKENDTLQTLGDLRENGTIEILGNLKENGAIQVDGEFKKNWTTQTSGDLQQDAAIQISGDLNEDGTLQLFGDPNNDDDTRTNVTIPPGKRGKRAAQKPDPRQTMPELNGQVEEIPHGQGKAQQKQRHIQPIIEPENTGVRVVDLPETEEEGGSVAATVIALLVCAVFLVGVSLVLFRKRRAKSEKTVIEIVENPGTAHKSEIPCRKGQADLAPDMEKADKEAGRAATVGVVAPTDIPRLDTDSSAWAASTDEEALSQDEDVATPLL